MIIDKLKTIPQYLIPKQKLSILAGCLARVKNPSVKNYIIQTFINTYKVNMKEALLENPEDYPTFNDFFIRHLKPGSRPLAKAEIISPVDGCISELGAIHEGSIVQAKGHDYSVQELLDCNPEIAKQFVNGVFMTLYLSPKDYHRVHMPIEANLESMNYIPGALFSVQPSTARVIPKLFARNERLVVYFSTEVGAMAMVLVGATIVGAIGTSWHGDVKRTKQAIPYDYKNHSKMLSQGEEMGYFKLGSTVVLLFAEGNKIQWQESLKSGEPIRLGEAIGHKIKN